MDETTLLQAHITKYIPAEFQKDPRFIEFTNKVNQTYKKLNNSLEEEKKSNEANRKLVMNSAFNVFIMFDSNGKITFWNNKAEILFGKKQADVIGERVYDIVFSSSHSIMCRKNIANYIKIGDTSNMYRQIGCVAIDKEAKEFPIEISITPIFQNNELLFCLFVKDATEVKRANDFSKNQEQKYRNIISNINIGLIEIDNEGLIQFANQNFAFISGYEISELIGKNPNELFASRKGIDIVESKKRIREIGIADIYQLEVKNKQGEIRWWIISGAPNYDNMGNIVGSVGLHLDITEQKMLGIELEKEKIKAEESAKAKELFLMNMSHEIRTPLNAIMGFLRELNREELNDSQKTFVDNSSLASFHLLAIINNVLDISKIEAKEMHLENKNFNFESKIENVLSVLQNKAKEKNLILTSYISDKINPILKGDILRIEQILYNIAGNSLKFTKKGTVAIRCEMRKDFPKSQDIRISITDTGIGMDSKFLKEIFNKFSQEDHAITRKFGGTGLGMSISYELVRLMNGQIEIESKKSKGTSVHIDINLKKGKIINSSDKSNQHSKINLKNISILLVEDNAINRIIAKKSLLNYNCSVTEVSNGHKAIEILKNQTFDVILMDIIMPEMDGIEATRHIRNELKIDTPIIAFTANAFKSEIEKFIELGMNDYVIKPFDENLLIQTIAKYTVQKNRLTNV
jgi:PAS domain S-box-containing protein